MDITLNSHEVEAAIQSYVERMGVDTTSKMVTIDVSKPRGQAVVATVSIEAGESRVEGDASKQQDLFDDQI